MSRLRRKLLLCAGGLLLAALAPLGPTSAAPGTSVTPYCGPAIAKTTGGLWRCTFADQFSGSALNSTKWAPMTTEATGVRTPDCRVASPQTIRVSGGTLKLSVLDAGVPFVCRRAHGDYPARHIAGAVSTWGKFSQAFGRFEIRAAMPDAAIAGLHSSIWMWPQERRYGPRSGEIDINERRTWIADLAVPTVHYREDGTAGPKTSWKCRIADPERFHTYALEWTRTTLKFIYDGRVCLAHEWKPAGLSKPRPFDEPYVMILSQNLGQGRNAFLPGITPLPATMLVDYVRIWS